MLAGSVESTTGGGVLRTAGPDVVGSGVSSGVLNAVVATVELVSGSAGVPPLPHAVTTTAIIDMVTAPSTRLTNRPFFCSA